MLRAAIAAASDRNTADALRARLADRLVKDKDLAGAVRLLEEIDPKGSMAGMRKLIPDLQSKMKEVRK